LLLRQATFHRFRNLDGTVEFCPGINFFTGRNGQGKSNVLESIFVGAHGRSFRAGKLVDLIKFGEPSALVDLVVCRDEADTPVSVTITPSERKLSIGGRTDCDAAEAMDWLRVIFFGPEDLDIVKGAPAARREFLDRAISAHYPPYATTLKTYNKLLRERNQLLRDIAARRPPPGGLMEAYEAELAKSGALLFSQRTRYVGELAPAATTAVREHTGGRLGLDVRYACAWAGQLPEKPVSPEDIQALPPAGGAARDAMPPASRITPDLLESRLVSARGADVSLGRTSVGPHTDDLDLDLNGKPARFFGSQGEQRQVAVSLKLAQLALWRNKFRVNPVLLLDDVMSELDPERQRLLLHAIDGWRVQTLISTTSKPDVVVEGSVCVFEVEEGRIRHVGQGNST